MLQRVTIIGAGNVGTHLALAFLRSGLEICDVYSKNIESAKFLAEQLNSAYSNDLKGLSDETDLYLIALPDRIINAGMNGFRLNKNRLVVHTSGSLPMEVLQSISCEYGVFYPLQTFSKDMEFDLRQTPICVEANNKENLEILKNLASHISDKVYEITSDERQILHLAAVFACNFPNHLYSIAEKILNKNNLPFDMLRPLILETAEKVLRTYYIVLLLIKIKVEK